MSVSHERPNNMIELESSGKKRRRQKNEKDLGKVKVLIKIVLVVIALISRGDRTIVWKLRPIKIIVKLMSRGLVI